VNSRICNSVSCMVKKNRLIVVVVANRGFEACRAIQYISPPLSFTFIILDTHSFGNQEGGPEKSLH
jgi:hypothetical protein